MSELTVRSIMRLNWDLSRNAKENYIKFSFEIPISCSFKPSKKHLYLDSIRSYGKYPL